MVGTEHSRRAGVSEAVVAGREDAMGSEEAKHTTEGLWIRPGNFGQLLGRPRRVVECVGDAEPGHGGQTVPDKQAPERPGQCVEGARLSIDRGMVIITGGDETPPIFSRLHAGGPNALATLFGGLKRSR